MPALGLCGCLFMVYTAFAGYGVKVFNYLAIYAAFMLVGNCFYRKKI